MSIIKSKQEKEIDKKLAAKKMIAQMDRYIEGLEKQRKVYLESAKKAVKLNMQPKLAVLALRATMVHQEKAKVMRYNFELTSQMKDMAVMTTDFLRELGKLSKDLAKLTNDDQFAKAQIEFEKAMTSMETQSERLELMLKNNESAITNVVNIGSDMSDADLEKMIMDMVLAEESGGEGTSGAIDRESQKIKELKG